MYVCGKDLDMYLHTYMSWIFALRGACSSDAPITFGTQFFSLKYYLP